MKLKSVLVVLMLVVAGIFAIRYHDPVAFRSAPKVLFKTITNKRIALNDLRGQPVIISFWATDCPLCIEEIPQLIELYRQFHQRGLEIIAVAMYYDPPSHVVAMTRAKQLPYDIALDLTAEHSKAFGHVMLTPTTFLISPQGYIAMEKTGRFDLVTMKQMIEGML